MKFLNPVGESRYKAGKDELSPRLFQVEGDVIGLLENGFGKEHFGRLRELLKEKERVFQFPQWVKSLPSAPSPEDVLSEITGRCHAAIVGLCV